MDPSSYARIESPQPFNVITEVITVSLRSNTFTVTLILPFSSSFHGLACRTYKRYYYFHNTTGESSWEYPEDEAKDKVTSSQVPVPPSQHPGQPMMHSPIQVKIVAGH